MKKYCPNTLAIAGAVAATSLPLLSRPEMALAADPVMSLNLASTLADTKAKIASGGTANIVVLGDSLSFRPGSYLPYFRDAMQGTYGNAGAGYQGYSLWTGGGLDPGWTYGPISGDIQPYQSLDGLWASTTAATTGYITPMSSTVQLQYVAQPGGGTVQPFTWGAGGGEVPLGPAINTSNATTQLKSQTLNLPTGASQIWFQTAGNGTVTILGENNTNSSPGVRVHRAANGGWGVENFLRRDWTFDAQLQSLNTDLVMVWLGVNDAEYDTASYSVALRQLISRVHSSVPDAQVVLVGSYDFGSTALERNVQAMQDVAAQDGVGFINMYGVAPSSTWSSHGYIDDGVHFADAGGYFAGTELFNAFLSDGASLTQHDATWTADSSGNWSTGSRWNGAAMPGTIDANVTFGNAITAPRTINVDIATIAGTLNFDSSNSYTLGGGGTILLVTQGSNGVGINVLKGSHTISAPILLNDNLRINVSSASSNLAIVQPISASGKSVTKTGAGNATLANVRASNLTVSGGTLSIARGSTSNDASSTSILGSLSISGSVSAPAGALDLGNSALIVNTSSPGSQLANIRGWLKSGGIFTSAVDGVHRIGYANNAVLGKTTFGGQPVTSSSLIVGYVLAGDADMNGKVDVEDLATLAIYWQQTSNVWTSGDFNYDGIVNIIDLGLLANNWQAGVSSPAFNTESERLLIQSFGLPGGAVPEPMALGGALTFVGAIVGSRRRQTSAC